MTNIRLPNIAFLCFCFAVFLISSAFFLAYPANAATYSNEDLFQKNQASIFQIKLIDVNTGSRSSIGSGFIVSNSHTLATNYHVISDAVYKPSNYKLVSVDSQGKESTLHLLNIDIVNDLALLSSQEPLGTPLVLAKKPPAKGTTIFAMGNPLDLGTTLVPGTFNGYADTSFYQRIHFSGSINSGMSGGPAFNINGEVLGINVASAGDQVSFLVPVEKLIHLIAQQPVQADSAGFMSIAQAQLTHSQEKLILEVSSRKWPQDKLGESYVIGDLPGLVKCWGRSTEKEPEKSLISHFNKGCSLQDDIYISQRTSTGSLHYQFFWIDGHDISDRKLNSYLENYKMHWQADNRVTKDDVSQYKCNEKLIESDRNETIKAFICARRYTRFPELYDVLYFQLRKRNNKALVSHFTLAGVTQKSSQIFHQGFTRNVTWP